MTDTTPAGTPAPKRTPAAKTTAVAKTPVAKAPTAKAPAAKTPAAKTPAAKTPVAKTPVANTPATRPTPKVTPKIAPKATGAPVTPVEPAAAATVPVVTDVAPAAVAPAGWYPVAAGSAQQRWWDGARWTEHVYEPPVAAQPVAPFPAAGPAPAATTLRAPAGTRSGTVWFWLLVIGTPVLTILQLIPTSIYLSQVIGGDTTDPTAAAANVFSPGYLLVLLTGWFIYAWSIVFGLLDWRELKARGVPKPFHWAWGLIVLAIGWPAVYVIGRTVIAKRRTGTGLAPLWVFIGLEVVTFIVSLVVVIGALIAAISLISDGLPAAGNAF